VEWEDFLPSDRPSRNLRTPNPIRLTLMQRCPTHTIRVLRSDGGYVRVVDVLTRESDNA
jgi:hypothetical protein